VSQPRYLTSQNIWRAIIAHLRSKPALKAAFVGDFHEGQAADKAPYPFCVWTPVVPGVYEDTWGERTIVALADVVAVSRSPVEASNLDQLVGEELDEAPLNVIGQHTLICYRVGDIRMSEPDEEGKKVYRVGGSYEIQTSQVEGVREHFLTLDAVIA
jgi:hypothetical protein